MSRLKRKYNEEILPALQNKYPHKNRMRIPALKKIVISMGLADAVKDKGLMQVHANELALLSGQKPIFTNSKKSISNFKLSKRQVGVNKLN